MDGDVPVAEHQGEGGHDGLEAALAGGGEYFEPAWAYVHVQFAGEFDGVAVDVGDGAFGAADGDLGGAEGLDFAVVADGARDDFDARHGVFEQCATVHDGDIEAAGAIKALLPYCEALQHTTRKARSATTVSLAMIS